VEAGQRPLRRRGNGLSAAGDDVQLKLPRRPWLFAAHESTRDAGSAAAEDDPWAGEDAAWTADDDLAPEERGEFVRFFRGALVGVVAGVALCALVALALALLL
jgi:hypothetical protein